MKFTRHAQEQIAAKGFSVSDVLRTAARPDISYESFRHPGQWKHIGNGLCVVVDPARSMIVTVFQHLVHTPLRPDQVAA